MSKRLVSVLVLAGLLMGCAGTSKMMLGAARAPIDPSQVRIYRSPPPGSIDIAEIDAASAIGFGTRGQDSAVMDRLRREAAALGANGLLIIGRGQSHSGGVSVGGGNYGRSSAVGLGVGIPTTQKRATAIAIYVPPMSRPLPPPPRESSTED